jgi:hypothetical protein
LTQPTLYGSKRRSSARPSTQPKIPRVWDIEREISRGMNGRRYTISPAGDSLGKRRSSEWGPRSSVDDSQASDSSLTVRGLKPDELENRRGSSALLRKSLQNTIHSPFSIWPSNQSRPRSPSAILDQNQNIRRRTSFTPKLQTHPESTGF